MNRTSKKVVFVAMGVLTIGASVGAGYWLAKRDANDMRVTQQAAPADNNKALYWYDPMVPDQHFDAPGKSPFMDMQLVPKYADNGGGDAGGITVSPTTQQNLGIRLAPVQQKVLSSAVDAVGTLGFNERELAVVQARTNGFVSRVYARAPGDVVTKDAALADIVVPEWVAAQQEFLALRQNADAALIAAARDRLALLGMPESVIRRVEHTGTAQTAMTITAPLGGVIQRLDVRAGMTVSTGMTLAQINALDSVWLTVAVPESLGAIIAVGDTLTAELTGSSGQPIDGQVIAVLPQTDNINRTMTVRAQLPNPTGQLRPGQYARVQLHGATSPASLVVPTAAVIRSGARTVVIVAEQYQFKPVAVQPGRSVGDDTEIRSGLQQGQQVVVSGQFLIDSEANLSGVMRQMSDSATEMEKGGVQ